MPLFDYRGRNRRGELQIGTIDSPDSQAVAMWMTSAGITPVTIAKRPVKSAAPPWMKRMLESKLPDMDLLIFTRQMSSMMRAGIPMLQALTGIQKSTNKPRLVAVLQALRDDLDKGLELSSAMARHPLCFSDFYVSMVRVGEGSGQLDTIFQRLFEQIEFDRNMKQKIKAALRYPMFVIIAVAIAVAILNIYVIPVFASVYAGMRVELPIATRILMASSSFTVKYWWVVLAVIALLFYAVKLYRARPDGRYRLDRLKVGVPLFGPILVKATVARFAFAFGMASRSGVPLVQNFTLASRVVDNAFYELRILQMRDGVERGESMLRVAQGSQIFSPLELQMISVGEETGEMDEMMDQIAKMYQMEVDYEVSKLTQTVEPLLIGSMGALVALLMMGVFLPLWDLGQMARK